MESIHKLIEIFKLSVLNIESVPDSFSSEVYKLTLFNLDNVYVKIPYNRDKLVREFEMLERLKGVIPVPKVLDFWDGDDRSVGALLLSAIDGGLVRVTLIRVWRFKSVIIMPCFMKFPCQRMDVMDPMVFRQ